MLTWLTNSAGWGGPGARRGWPAPGGGGWAAASVVLGVGFVLGLAVGCRSAEAGAAGGAVDAPPAAPIVVEPVHLQTDAGPVRGYVVKVNLADPRVEVVVSDGDERLSHERAEVVLTPTHDFVNETGCTVAVNANFFGWLEDENGKKTLADIVGLSVTDGVVVSEPREHAGEGDPAIVFNRDNRARVLDLSTQQLQSTGDVWDGVAGIGGSDTDATPGTLLVIDGVSHGATARPAPTKRHPRTAAGVDADGDTLYLAVIDGRQLGHSVGITLVELADLMIEAGVDDALNLDGGGSTALLAWTEALDADATFPDPDGDGWLTNRPSDGRYRPVANHLGIRLSDVTPESPAEAYVFKPDAPPSSP